MKRFITLLYSKASRFLLILIGMQIGVTLMAPANPINWLALWFQVGMLVMDATDVRFRGPWWTFREALCWPLVYRRYLKERDK